MHGYDVRQMPGVAQGSSTNQHSHELGARPPALVPLSHSLSLVHFQTTSLDLERMLSGFVMPDPSSLRAGTAR
jgi:hypothetical protein